MSSALAPGRTPRWSVPGEHVEGCYTGIEFLSRLVAPKSCTSASRPSSRGQYGHDCARTLIRLGAKSICSIAVPTRRTPATVEIEARSRGSPVPVPSRAGTRRRRTIRHILSPPRIPSDGVGEPDASGRRRPVPVTGSETLLATDMVIRHRPDRGPGHRGPGHRTRHLKTTRWRTVEVNHHDADEPALSVRSRRCRYRAALVVDAIGGGRAARSSTSSSWDSP